MYGTATLEQRCKRQRWEQLATLAVGPALMQGGKQSRSRAYHHARVAVQKRGSNQGSTFTARAHHHIGVAVEAAQAGIGKQRASVSHGQGGRALHKIESCTWVVSVCGSLWIASSMGSVAVQGV